MLMMRRRLLKNRIMVKSGAKLEISLSPRATSLWQRNASLKVRISTVFFSSTVLMVIKKDLKTWQKLHNRKANSTWLSKHISC